MITISEIDHLDEVKKYQTQRYLSSSYCYWRIAEFDMVQIKPPVLQLNIHLSEQQLIVYQPNIANAEVALQCNVNTPLTSYFHLNYLASKSAREPSQPNLRSILFEDFPTYFVWSAKDHCWSLRKRGEQVGRMVSVHPLAGNGEIVSSMNTAEKCTRCHII